MTAINEASYETRISLLERQLQHFMAEQRQVNAVLLAHNVRTDEFIAEQQAFNAEQRQHNDRTDAFIAEQRQFNAEQRDHNARTDEFITDQKQFNASAIARMDRMQNDISDILGDQAERRIKEDAAGIAYEMGYEFIRALTKADLLEIHRQQDTAGIDTHTLRSFREADLIIATTDDNGNAHYIVVEISHTADHRDTDRAIRNCALITRFTGQPAHPAIASVRNDRHAQALIDNGEIYWRAITQRRWE